MCRGTGLLPRRLSTKSAEAVRVWTPSVVTSYRPTRSRGQSTVAETEFVTRLTDQPRHTHSRSDYSGVKHRVDRGKLKEGRKRCLLRSSSSSTSYSRPVGPSGCSGGGTSRTRSKCGYRSSSRRSGSLRVHPGTGSGGTKYGLRLPLTCPPPFRPDDP